MNLSSTEEFYSVQQREICIFLNVTLKKKKSIFNFKNTSDQFEGMVKCMVLKQHVCYMHRRYSRNMSADDKCALEWILQGKWNDARRIWVWWFKQWNIILGLWEAFLAVSSVSSQKLCKYNTMPVSSTELPRLNLNLPRIVLANVLSDDCDEYSYILDMGIILNASLQCTAKVNRGAPWTLGSPPPAFDALCVIY